MSIFFKNSKNIDQDNFFVNCFLGNLIKCGNRNKAYVIYANLLLNIKKEFPLREPREILVLAIDKIKPLVNLRVKKVAGISYQLPCPIEESKSIKIAINWLFKSLEMRRENTLDKRLFSEILDIIKDKGVSLQRKISHEKVALDNRAFLFFLKK